MSVIWELDITDVIDFINEHKKSYTSLPSIFKGLCWRLQRDEEKYYNDKYKVYMIKSAYDYKHGLVMILAVKKDEANRIKKIAGIMLEDKKNGIILKSHPKK